MHLIIGLGNPGPQYTRTRHNAGFMVLDELAHRHKAKFKSNPRLLAEVIELSDLILAKPETFMNTSGRSVAKLLQKYSLSAEDILVVYDDVDTTEGLVRFRQKGSSGGHNGIKSIIEAIGTDFPRLKIGVGKKPGHDTADYVLAKMSPAELEPIKEAVSQAADRIDAWDF